MLCIRDVDLKILQKLGDGDLGRVSSTNKKLNLLCKDESLWMNKTFNKFGFIFSKYSGDSLAILSEKIRQYKKKSQQLTWRSYYISLIKFIDTLYSTSDYYEDMSRYLESPKVAPFEDKIFISQYISEKKTLMEEKIEEGYGEYNSPIYAPKPDNSGKLTYREIIEKIDDAWMDDPFMDITKLFLFITYKLRKGKKYMLSLLDKMLDRYNFKITDEIIWDVNCRLREEGLNLLLKKRNMQSIRPTDLDTMIMEYGDRQLELILRYMTKDDILYALFIHFPDFFDDYVEIILREAIKKGATSTDIIKNMKYIPDTSDIVDYEFRRFYKDSLKCLLRILKEMQISEEDGKILKEVVIQKIQRDIKPDSADVCFDILGKF